MGDDNLPNQDQPDAQAPTTEEPTTRWLTVKQAARYLNRSENSIYRDVRSGALKAGRAGGAWRIHVDDIDRWVRAGGNRHRAEIRRKASSK